VLGVFGFVVAASLPLSWSLLLGRSLILYRFLWRSLLTSRFETIILLSIRDLGKGLHGPKALAKPLLGV